MADPRSQPQSFECNAVGVCRCSISCRFRSSPLPAAMRNNGNDITAPVSRVRSTPCAKARNHASEILYFYIEIVGALRLKVAWRMQYPPIFGGANYLAINKISRIPYAERGGSFLKSGRSRLCAQGVGSKQAFFDARVQLRTRSNCLIRLFIMTRPILRSFLAKKDISLMTSQRIPDRQEN